MRGFGKTYALQRMGGDKPYKDPGAGYIKSSFKRLNDLGHAKGFPPK